MKRWIVPILTLVFATCAYSQEAERVATHTRISKQSSTDTGDRGLFTVPSAETLNKGQFSAGIGWTNIDRSPRDLDIASVPVFFSFGVHGRLTVTGTFETQRQVTARNLSQSGFNDAYPFVSSRFEKGYGDTTLAAKYRFMRQRNNIGGLSLRGSVVLPTADKVSGLGSGATSVGADIVFSSLIPLDIKLDAAIGYLWTTKVTDPVTNTSRHIRDQIRSGIGVTWPAAGIKIGGRLQAIGEFTTLTFVGAGANNAARSKEDSNDVVAGLRYLLLDSGITMSAAYRTNTKFDFSFPGNKDRNGFVFSVAFTKPLETPGSNRYPVVSLESSAEEIRVGGSATITATGYDADKDPLTYTWSASAGQITGSGEMVTFNAAGLAAGKYTIRTTVTDGKGGSATSLIDVTVR